MSDNMVTGVHIVKEQERGGMNGEWRGEEGMILLHTNRDEGSSVKQSLVSLRTLLLE